MRSRATTPRGGRSTPSLRPALVPGGPASVPGHRGRAPRHPHVRDRRHHARGDGAAVAADLLLHRPVLGDGVGHGAGAPRCWSPGRSSVFMLCWVAWQFALGSAVDQDFLGDGRGRSPAACCRRSPPYVLLTSSINVVYFLGADRRRTGRLARRPAARRARRAGHDDRPAGRRAAPARGRRRAAPDRPRAARRRRPPRLGDRRPGRRRPPGAATTTRRRPAARARRDRGELARGGHPDALAARHAPRHRGADDRAGSTPSARTPRAPASPTSPALVAAAHERRASRRRTSRSRTTPGAAARLPATVGSRSTAPPRRRSPTSPATRPPATRRSRCGVPSAAPAPFAEVEVLDDGRLRTRHLRLRPRAARHPGAGRLPPRRVRDRPAGDPRLPGPGPAAAAPAPAAPAAGGRPWLSRCGCCWSTTRRWSAPGSG